MAVRRNLIIRGGVDITQFSKGMNKMQKELQQKAKKMGDISSKMAKAVSGPLLAIFAISTKGMEEMRGDLAKLETNATMAGQGIESLHKQMAYLNAITGETDSNVETLSNLMASGFKNSDMEQVVNSLAGAVIKFPDTMKLEGMADGLQETLATGKAIGPFSELLERSGLNLEDFNEGLTKAIANGEQHNYILRTLASTGLSQVNDKFRENNQELIENAESQYTLKQSLTELGNTLQPIMTQLINVTQSLVGWFNNLSQSQQKWVIGIGIAVIAINGLMMVYQKLILLKAVIVGWYKAATIAKIIHTAATNKETAATMAETAAKNASLLTMIKVIASYAAHKVALVASTVATWVLAGATWAVTVAQIAFNAAFMASPLGWVALGVMALIAVFVLLWNKLSGFKEFWKKLWGDVKSIFKSVINGVIGIINAYLSAVKFMVNGAIWLINGLIKGMNKIPGISVSLIPKLEEGDMQIPKLANGGIAYGNTIANVGEYANARSNPEVIAPLDKLQSMIGSGSTNISVYVDNDLITRKVVKNMGKDYKIQIG